MKVSDLIVKLLEVSEPETEVLIVDNNGLAWCLEESDIKAERSDDGPVVLFDSPNVNTSGR